MKKSMLFLLSAITVMGHSQVSDSSAKKINIKRHEIGINVLPTLLFISNAKSVQPKFFNVTYRYLLNNKNALRITSGFNFYNTGGYPVFTSDIVSQNNNLTVVKNTSNRTPINVTTGLGYERILGKHKIKHVIGFDLTYSYSSKKTIVDYYGFKDSLVNGVKHMEFVPIDTGKTKTQIYAHKFGIAPFYSLRYELSSKWLVTASTRLNLQYYQMKYPGHPASKFFDFNTSGLLSELSFYYRF